MSQERLILIPGMGADERLFEPQRAGGLKFDVPHLPIPQRHDDFAAYAARVHDQLELVDPCVVGGVSFGGMVACELARLCQPRCVLLIASCQSGLVIPPYNHVVELISRVFPDFLIKRRCVASSRMLAKMESLSEEQYRLIRDMSLDVPVLLLRRAARMILNWKGPESIPCPVHQIHGGKDRIIPIRSLSPEEVIVDGGHLINLTHSQQVNSFIARHTMQSG